MKDKIFAIRNSRFRKWIWPVRSNEFIKFFPMAIMMFIILLNQNIVRIMKDSIVMTLVGPEVISFVKLWFEMPAGILFVVLYTKLCNRVSTEDAFRLIVTLFLCFFGIFAFFVFPNSDYLHPSAITVQKYIAIYPHIKWFLVIWSKWTYIIFYVMGELWPVIVFSLLFWQLANKITKTEEAGRFYSFFSLFGQTNLLISGSVVLYFQSNHHCFMFLFTEGNYDSTELMLKSLMLVVLLSGILLLAIHYFIEVNVINKIDILSGVTKKQILKLSVRESLRMIVKSKYLGLICLLIISYGMSVNLIEGVWMSKVREQYTSPKAFGTYQGNVLFWTGVFTLICSFIGSTIIRNFGWFWGAIITPCMILVAGGFFFFFVSIQDMLQGLFAGITFLTPLAIINFIGGLQNVLGKGTKYSLFDATKEMAYIPLDPEMKTKGKAAVDVIGNKIGKSTGALVQFLAFTFFPSAQYQDLTGFIACFFVTICLVWIYAVKELSKMYNSMIKEN